jgi:hypothetical protein
MNQKGRHQDHQDKKDQKEVLIEMAEVVMGEKEMTEGATEEVVTTEVTEVTMEVMTTATQISLSGK